MKIFFYDDQDLRVCHGLHRAYGPVTKKGAVSWPRPDWDLHEASVFAGSIISAPDGGCRLYYSGRDPEKERAFGIAVAESSDGITWTKPGLGQVKVGGEDTNRIQPDGMPDVGSLTQPQVLRMPDGSWP